MRQYSGNKNDKAKPTPNPEPTNVNKRITPSLSCHKLSDSGGATSLGAIKL